MHAQQKSLASLLHPQHCQFDTLDKKGFSLLQRHSQNANLRSSLDICGIHKRKDSTWNSPYLTIAHGATFWMPGWNRLNEPTEPSNPPERENRGHGQPVFLGIFWISKQNHRGDSYCEKLRSTSLVRFLPTWIMYSVQYRYRYMYI